MPKIDDMLHWERSMYKLVIFLLLVTGAGYFIWHNGVVAKFQEYITLKHMVKLTSSAFIDNGLIPSLYTCDGMGVNPPLDIQDVPGNAQTMVLIVDDPDAPAMTFTHWIVYNIPANTTAIPEKGIPPTSDQLAGSSGTVGYTAPCPPSGTHRYIFTLYVLDAKLSLEEGSGKTELLHAMENHTIDKTQLIGRYTKAN